MADSWREQLRAARRALGISLRDLALRTGLSYETVRGYENGRRRPSRDSLLSVLRHLGASAVDANAIVEAAGFAPEPTLFPEASYPSYFFKREELDDAVELVPWSQFVSNDDVAVMAANTAIQALWDIDFAHERRTRTRAQMSLLSVASDHKFADRVVNWDDVISVMASIFKGRPRRPASMDEPDAYLSEVLAEFAKGDPAFLARLIAVWTAAEPMAAKVRWHYRVTWSDIEFGEMRFLCCATTCSEPDGFAFNDWHPIDAPTWQTLEQVKHRAASK